MGFFTLIILGFMLTGCMTKPLPRTEQFLSIEYEQYSKLGTAVVMGDVFLVTKRGDVKKGAGFPVTLTPVTSYSMEWYQRGILKNTPLEPPDERSRAYQWEVIADGDGRFEFEQLPAGDYYLVSKVFWEEPALHWYSSPQEMGGLVHTKVSVKAGQRKKVALTQPR